MSDGRDYIRQAKRVQAFIVAGVIGAMVVVAAFFGLAWYLHGQQVEHDRQAIVRAQQATAQARHELCAAINELKADNRDDATHDYAQTVADADHDLGQLDRTLALLHLTRTPEIVQVAQETHDRRVAGALERRDRKLARNQPKEC